MRVIRINTTAYSEEDFFLLTTLTDKEISDVFTPIVDAEREGNSYYDNDLLVSELQERYPSESIQMILIEDITI
jgi:hypothetical protein